MRHTVQSTGRGSPAMPHHIHGGPGSRHRRPRLAHVALLVAAVALSACGGGGDGSLEPTASPTRSADGSVTASVPSPTRTAPSRTRTPRPSEQPSDQPTATATATVTQSAGPRPTRTATETSTRTATVTATPTPSETPSATPSETPGTAGGTSSDASNVPSWAWCSSPHSSLPPSHCPCCCARAVGRLAGRPPDCRGGGGVVRPHTAA